MSAVIAQKFTSRGERNKGPIVGQDGAIKVDSLPFGLLDVAPDPKIKKRPIDASVMQAAEREGYSPLQARVIAGRMKAEDSALPIGKRVQPKIGDLDSYENLPDIDLAVGRICNAIQDGEVIACVVDHDADGSTAGAVMLTSLVEYFGVPQANVILFNSHRMKEGYGVSNAVVDRILQHQPRPSLIITGDQGSADHERVTRMLAEGIQTVVTDHHEIPARGVPEDAIAVVNPAREDSIFADKNVAGCHVSWLVMCAVRAELIKRGYLPATAPRLGDLLDWVALGSACDAVSLAKSINNRALIAHGLKVMNAKRRPAWEGMAVVLGKQDAYTAPDLAWKIGPRLNARSRLSEAMTGVQFLMSTDYDQAVQLATVLEQDNTTRRAIEKELTAAAMTLGALQASSGSAAIVVRLDNGHAGIHGITASRLTEAYGRPTMMLSPKEGEVGVFTGSLRTAAGVNVKQAMDQVSEWEPDLLLSYGGHHGAGGLRVQAANIELLQELFCEAVLLQVHPSQLHPQILSDGELDGSPSLSMVDELAQLEPYGREFDPPVFHGQFQVLNSKVIGADKTHLKLSLKDRFGGVTSAIWFGAVKTSVLRHDDGEPIPPVVAGDMLNAAYTLTANTFRGKTTVDLQIKHARKASNPTS